MRKGYEEKIEIYEKRQQGERITELMEEYKMKKSEIKYLINLIEKHGDEIVREKRIAIITKNLKKKR